MTNTLKTAKNHEKVILPASHWLRVNVLLNNTIFMIMEIWGRKCFGVTNDLLVSRDVIGHVTTGLAVGGFL